MSKDYFTTKNEEYSWFADVESIAPKEVFSLRRQFAEDDFDYKLDFAFPCYHDEHGKPWVLPEVRIAETVLANDYSLSKEYLHPLGYETFNKSAVALLLGEQSRARIESRAFAVQTISATGALRMGAEFLAEVLGITTIYATQQVADDIETIFLKSGFLEYKQLRYFNHHTLSLDMPAMLEDLQKAEEGAVLFMQVSGHNPTGCDPSIEDWDKIAEIVFNKKLFMFFYSPFQGFASGDVDKDVEAVHMFESRGFEFLCAQSFAWNFGLYNERSGCLTVVVGDTNKVGPVKSQLLFIASSMYSTPPSHGARIVAFILGDRMLSEHWKDSIKSIAQRLRQMREYLREEMERLGAHGRWSHITDQVGLFCYTGLSDIQVEHLKKQHHIYIMSNGRLNVSGLNFGNVEHVAKAIQQTLLTIPPSYLTCIV